MVDFYAREGFDYFDEVLFQHGVIEAAEVVADEGVAPEFVSVVAEGFLVFF